MANHSPEMFEDEPSLGEYDYEYGPLQIESDDIVFSSRHKWYFDTFDVRSLEKHKYNAYLLIIDTRMTTFRIASTYTIENSIGIYDQMFLKINESINSATGIKNVDPYIDGIFSNFWEPIKDDMPLAIFVDCQR